MIIGKENLIFFENLAKEQKRIYPDACDYGIECGGELFGIKIKARQNLVELMKIYETQISRWGNKESSHGSATTLFIPFEYEGKGYQGVQLAITHNIDCQGKKEFLTIDITAGKCHDNPFKEN